MRLFAAFDSWCSDWDMTPKPAGSWWWCTKHTPQGTLPDLTLQGRPVQKKIHSREIGFHVNYGRRRVAVTHVKRVTAAKAFLLRLQRLPGHLAQSSATGGRAGERDDGS